MYYLSDVVIPIGKAFNESVERHSDVGSCVLGYKLFVGNKQVCPQPFQGSIGCEHVYNDMKDVLMELGYRPEDIRIEYGRMD